MDVSYKDRLDEHFEGELKTLFGKAEEAIEDGAERVTIYPIPHAHAGTARRCTTCGGRLDDEIHRPE